MKKIHSKELEDLDKSSSSVTKTPDKLIINHDSNFKCVQIVGRGWRKNIHR